MTTPICLFSSIILTTRWFLTTLNFFTPLLIVRPFATFFITLGSPIQLIVFIS